MIIIYFCFCSCICLCRDLSAWLIVNNVTCKHFLPRPCLIAVLRYLSCDVKVSPHFCSDFHLIPHYRYCYCGLKRTIFLFWETLCRNNNRNWMRRSKTKCSLSSLILPPYRHYHSHFSLLLSLSFPLYLSLSLTHTLMNTLDRSWCSRRGRAQSHGYDQVLLTRGEQRSS